MKTLFPLTSRGRVRVFFNGPDNPRGAEGRIADAKAIIRTGVKNTLAGVSLLILNTVTPVSDASAQTPEPTRIAAATVTPGSECAKIPDSERVERMKCRNKKISQLDEQITNSAAELNALLTKIRNMNIRTWDEYAGQLELMDFQKVVDFFTQDLEFHKAFLRNIINSRHPKAQFAQRILDKLPPWGGA